MANLRTFYRSFAGGVISPEMFGRIDDRQYQTGARTMRNVYVHPQGAASRRPGSVVVREVKDSTKQVRLVPFAFSTDQTVVIEVGEGYFRFHSDGQTLLYSAPTAYKAAVNISSVNTGTDTITVASHTFDPGEPVYVYTTGSLPGGLAAATAYYVINPTSTTFQLSTSSTGTAVDLQSSGSLSTVARAYDLGEIVSYLGGNYHCKTPTFGVAPAPAPSDASYWYPLPAAPNILEVPNTFTEEELFELTHRQSNDIVTFASAAQPPTELRRYGAERWGFAAVTVGAHVAAPEGLAVAPTYGRLFAIGSLSDHLYTTPPQFSQPVAFNCDTRHVFTTGTSLYATGGDYLAPGNYVVDQVNPGATSFRLSRVSDGGQIQHGVAFVSFAGVSPADLVATVLDGGGTTPPGSGSSITHNMAADTPIRFAGGTLPTGFSTSTTYYVSAPSGATFKIAATPGGAALQVASVGSGTHTLQRIDADRLGGTFSPYTLTFREVSLSSDDEQTYAVTAIDDDDVESELSDPVTVENNLFVAGSSNSITWFVVPGAVRYRVYKKISGLFGFIGEVDAATAAPFIDDNIGPDLAITPPKLDTEFSGNSPRAVGFYEQRRVFAGSDTNPQRVWATRSGTESDMTYHIPLQDDDRLKFDVAALELSTIRHIVPLQHLMLLSSSTEYRVTPLNNDALTPTSISVRPQSYVGANPVQPVVVNNVAVFCGARDGHVYELGFNGEATEVGDLSLRANALFDGKTPVDLAQQRAPTPVLWFVHDDGTVAALTYIPREQVGAWHQHDTEGDIESVCVVAEGVEDRVYWVVQRGSVRIIERLDVQRGGTVFLDAATTYSGAPATSFSGLLFDDDTEVTVIADGVETTATVSSGAITLPTAASTVVVGLPYVSLIETLPLAMQIDGFGQGTAKNINKAWVRFRDSTAGAEIGPADDALVPVVPDGTLEVEVVLPGTWSTDGRIQIRQSAPAPMHVVGLTLQVAVGG